MKLDEDPIVNIARARAAHQQTKGKAGRPATRALPFWLKTAIIRVDGECRRLVTECRDLSADMREVAGIAKERTEVYRRLGEIEP